MAFGSRRATTKRQMETTNDIPQFRYFLERPAPAVVRKSSRLCGKSDVAESSVALGAVDFGAVDFGAGE